ncbi:Cof-type HAD-IIB family hydrolase [Actinomycetes bacterium NPDC127524]
MEKKIVFFDLDGTILDENKQIPESTKKAVQMLQENGISTVIATGRVPIMFEWILKELNIDSFVSINGQYVVYEGSEIYTNPMDGEMLADLTNAASGKGHAIAYCGSHAVNASEEKHEWLAEGLKTMKLDYPVVDREFYRHTPVYQAHLYCGTEDDKLYSELYPGYKFVRWGENAFDVLPEGASKAIGIEKMLKAAGIKNENSFAFGDGYNDIEMLEAIGTGIAMGNGVAEAKEAADMVTDSCSEDGIYNALLKLGLIQKNEAAFSVQKV